MPLTDALARRGAALLAHVFARRWAGAAAGALAGRRLGVVGLGSLAALVAAAVLALAPVGAQSPEEGEPSDFALKISLAEDSDNIVPPGGSLTARAVVTFSGNPPNVRDARADEKYTIKLSEAGLRLSGPLDWEADGRASLSIGDLQFGGGEGVDEATDAIAAIDDASGDDPKPPLANSAARGRFQASAWDGRTLVTRVLPTTGVTPTIQLFDTSTSPPTYRAQVQNPVSGRHDRFSAGRNDILSPDAVAVAVWHADENNAWLFVGAPHAQRSSQNNIGALYIYQLTYDSSGELTVDSSPAKVQPPSTEYTNRESGTVAEYGSSVAISADGSTLVVSAPHMNHLGAVYVYSRPSGGWGAVGGSSLSVSDFYNSGVKLTAVAVPSWGTASDRPFPSALSDSNCDAYCRRVQAHKRGNSWQNATEFGMGPIGVSADGSVIAFGAPAKLYADDTPATGFTSGVNNGEVFVFEAPAGGWSSVGAVSGTQLLAANTAIPGSGNFDPSTRHSPGPDKRVTSPTARLRPDDTWDTDDGDENFGVITDISGDGATVAVSAGFARPTNTNNPSDNAAIYMFERSGARWSSTNTPAATYTLNASERQWGAWGMQLDPEGETLIFGQRVYWAPRGRAVVIKKGDGWSDFEVPIAAGAFPADENRWEIRQPFDLTVATWFGAPLYDLQGSRLAISATGDRYQNNHPGKVWIFESNIGGCTTRTLDGLSTNSCPLSVENGRIVIPPGTAEGTFTISGSVKIGLAGEDPTTLRGALEVTIGTVDEVASVSLGVATDLADPTISSDDRPYPSTLKRKGDSTRLLLSVLNANGTASAQGSVSSVLVTTDAGELGLLDSSLSSNCQGLSCQLNVSRVTAANSDRLVFTLTHAGRATAATVNATVFSAAGNSYETDPVEITLAGAAASIAIAEPTRAVLNVDAGSTVDDETFDDTTDTRDQLVLAVTATDAAGVGVDVPTSGRRATVTDADGKVIAKSSAEGTTGNVTVAFPHRTDHTRRALCTGMGTPPDLRNWLCRVGGAPSVAPLPPPPGETPNTVVLDLAGNPQVGIEVNHDAADPLRPGEYTLTVYAGGKTATQTFTVTGGPASDGIAISDPGSPVVGDTFSVTVMVEDAEGNPVPDGTVVEWEPLEEERRTVLAEGALAVQTSATTRTKEGKVTAEYLVVDAGVIVIKVHAAPASAARRVELQPAPRQPSEDPTVDLTNRNPEGFSVWLGVGETTASALLERLDGPNTLAVWMDGDWRYYRATAAGAVGEDFAVRPGALLWVDLR